MLEITTERGQNVFLTPAYPLLLFSRFFRRWINCQAIYLSDEWSSTIVRYLSIFKIKFEIEIWQNAIKDGIENVRPIFICLRDHSE